MIKITTDSTCDLPERLLAQLIFVRNGQWVDQVFFIYMKQGTVDSALRDAYFVLKSWGYVRRMWELPQETASLSSDKTTPTAPQSGHSIILVPVASVGSSPAAMAVTQSAPHSRNTAATIGRIRLLRVFISLAPIKKMKS